MRIHETTHCRKLVGGGKEQAKIQIQTSDFWSQKKLATAWTWLPGKSELIEKKWHEESSVNLKIKVTFGYFCGIFVLNQIIQQRHKEVSVL